MKHGLVKVTSLIQDEITDQGQSPSSSLLDTLPSGIKGVVEVDCAGAVGLAAGGGLAFSKVLACRSAFCLGSSCDSLRGPISPVLTEVLCCCDAGEDLHAQSCHCCSSLRSDLLVLLGNCCCCRLGCGMSVWSRDASSGPLIVALYHPTDAEVVCVP